MRSIIASLYLNFVTEEIMKCICQQIISYKSDLGKSDWRHPSFAVI